MNLKLPIALTNPIGVLRQWAAELRAKTFISHEDFQFQTEDIFNFGLSTIGSGVSLIASHVLWARIIPIQELITIRIRFSCEVSFTDKGGDVRGIFFEMPNLSRASDVVPPAPVPGDLYESELREYNILPCSFRVRRLSGVATYAESLYSGLCQERLFVNTFEPRTKWSCFRDGAAALGAYPYAFPNSSLITVTINGFFETQP